MAILMTAAVLTACIERADRSASGRLRAIPPRTRSPGSGDRPASIQYVPLDAPAGMSQAVIVQGVPLVHTRQLLPLDRRGEAGRRGFGRRADRTGAGQSGGRAEGLRVGPGQARPTERLRPGAGDRHALARTAEPSGSVPSVRPAITSVLTPLPHRKALVAVDAVAAGDRRRRRP